MNLAPRMVRRIAAMIIIAAAAIVPPAAAVERVYYIAADEVPWDYAPSAPINPLMAAPFTPEENVFVQGGKTHIGHVYVKAIYRAYTDATFTTLKPRGPDEAHLGLLGPIIRAEVGDTLKIVFRNNTRLAVGIHPHGVRYDKASEGSHYAVGSLKDGSATLPEGGAHIPHGGEYIYHWDVPEDAGPGPNDPSSTVWLYHAHDHAGTDIYSGLVGAIIVTRAGMAKPDGTPKDVDREFLSLFMIFDENMSPLLDASIRRFAAKPFAVRINDPEFIESNKKHAINGYLYGNMEGLTMRRGERVRWYLLALGNEQDLHTAHWHGNTAIYQGRRLDTIGLLPATTETVDMRPENVGTWMFHCHVADHMAGGMMTRYTVTE